MLFLLKYKAVNIWNLCRNVFKWIFVGCLNMDWFFCWVFLFFFQMYYFSEQVANRVGRRHGVCKQSLNCVIKTPWLLYNFLNVTLFPGLLKALRIAPFSSWTCNISERQWKGQGLSE